MNTETSIMKRLAFTMLFLFLCSCGETTQAQVDTPSPHFQDLHKTQREQVVKINFQPEGTSKVEGYLVDSGHPFSKKSNGFSYGWSQDVSVGLRDRNKFHALDQRFDTLAHIVLEKSQIDAYWEIALPNGAYNVHIVVGDPSYAQDKQAIKIEGHQAFDTNPNQHGYISSYTKVNVSDGRLTIESAARGKGYVGKINFIEIFGNNTHKALLSPLPINNVETIELNTHRFIHWQNPYFNFNNNYLVELSEPLSSPIVDMNRLLNTEAKVKYLGRASNVLIANNTDNYHYIVSANEQDVLSLPKLIAAPQTPQLQTKYQLKTNLVKAMELTKRWSDNDDVFQLHNLFSEHLYDHQLNQQKNAIIKDSIWQYDSSSSAAIAFQTASPEKTYVKYWNDSDSKTTNVSLRPLYTHIHYLKNLTANSTYQYKVVSYDNEQEVTMYHGTIETKPEHNTQQLYTNKSSRFPLLLSKANTTYTLQNDIESADTAFIVTANNITLDLNGYTIKQLAQADGDNKPVITTHEGLNRFSLFNGNIIQSPQANLNNKHLVDIGDIKQIEVAGLTIEYSQPQTIALVTRSKDKKLLPYDQSIHHNQFIDKGWQVSNRHGSGGAVAIKFDNEFGYNESTLMASYNLILRTRQNGIQGATYAHNNEIYTDSWTTNSFSIQPFSRPNKQSGRYANNKLFLTGYHAIAFGWGHEDLLVENNYIEMQGLNSKRNRWWEGFGDQNSLNGLRITNYGKGGQIRNNLKYYNNKIVGMARNGSMMRGTELYSDHSISGTEVRWSEIDIRAEDNKSTNVSAVVTQGTANNDHQVTVYRDSILRSNVAIVRFGDNYGRGHNHIFDNVFFDKVRGNDNFATFIFDGGYSGTGHRIIDGTFSNGAKWDDVFWRRTSTASFYQVLNVKDGKEVEVRPVEWHPNDTRAPEVKNKKQHQLVTKG